MDVRHPAHGLIDALLWALVALMAFLVVYTSVRPPGNGAVPVSDKLLHFTAYMGLTMSMLLAAVWAPVRGEGRFPATPLAIVALVFFFGVAIEIVQGPLPGRDAELLDAFANAGGAVTALVVWTFWRKTAEKPRPR